MGVSLNADNIDNIEKLHVRGMTLSKLLKTHLSIISLVVSVISCSRDVTNSTMSLSIKNPSAMGALGATSTPPPPPLQTLIVNIQVPNQPPLVQQIDYQSGTVPPATIDLTFPNVPTNSSLLIQALGVYGGTGGGIQFKYNDAAVTLSGDQDVSLTLAAAGGATKMSRLAGRVSIGGVLPTGTLVARFAPPTENQR